MLLINIVMLAAISNMESATIYNFQNASKMFQFYKNKYHKIYKNKNYENQGFKNFLSNLNRVTALNENTPGNDTLFVLNKYADLNQGVFEEHYGLNVTPYDATTLHREFWVPTDGLRNRIEFKPEPKSVEQIDLYDLDDADNLYKKYMKDFNKQNSTNEYERTVHYYRFLKTLVEMNKDHYKGSHKKLDAKADTVKRPFDYIY